MRGGSRPGGAGRRISTTSTTTTAVSVHLTSLRKRRRRRALVGVGPACPHACTFDRRPKLPCWADAGRRRGPESRRARLWECGRRPRGVPLLAILATVGVVVVVFMAGKLIYKLREIILLMVVAGFIALLLNPVVVLAAAVEDQAPGLSPWPS